MKEIKYYLWFVHEIIFNPKLEDFIMGRIEIHSSEEEYSIKEIRIFTNKGEEFNNWFYSVPKIVNSLEEIEEIENYINENINNGSYIL